MSATTMIYLVRHGKTFFNTSQRVQGWCDTPLTPEGRQGIAYLGKGLAPIHFAKAYASDSGRARETAQIILNEQVSPPSLESDARLREWSFGSYEGEPEHVFWQAIERYQRVNQQTTFQDRRPDFETMASLITSLDTEGWTESYAQISTRLTMSLTEIAQERRAAGGGNILIVSHGLSIAHLLFLIDPTKAPTHSIENGAVAKLHFNEDRFEILSSNDTTYIAKGKQA